VRVWLDSATEGDLVIEVREVKSGKIAGQASARLSSAGEQTVNIDVPISDCRLWSPEDPFLYELIARTAGDRFQTRFGMRTFKFDPATGRAILNGKPYFMRGSNITLYRFFEDPQCGNLPWSEEWVRTLHRRVKDMRWNCLRYCIGFPPEFWYRIADEEGILIQDEFPIWNMEGGKLGEYDVDSLAGEYREWMQERWNHPCVVIWDACNETRSPDIAKAFTKVRGLDMSNRPWDNGWQPPQDPGDCIESHPYHFIDSKFKLSDLAKSDPAKLGKLRHVTGPNAVVINEYAWLLL
jgi:beta-galactosidase/beta-glucuronidase